MLRDEIEKELDKVSELVAKELEVKQKEEETTKRKNVEGYIKRLVELIDDIPNEEFYHLEQAVDRFFLGDGNSLKIQAFLSRHLLVSAYDLEQLKYQLSDIQRVTIFHAFQEKIKSMKVSYAKKQIILNTLMHVFHLKKRDYVLECMPFVLEVLEIDMNAKREIDPILFFQQSNKRNLGGEDESINKTVLSLLKLWYDEKGRKIYYLENHPVLDGEEGIDVFIELSYLFDDETIEMRKEQYLDELLAHFEKIKNEDLNINDRYLALFHLFNQTKKVTGEF